MKHAIKSLWDNAFFRVSFKLGLVGFAPIYLLSMAKASLTATTN